MRYFRENFTLKTQASNQPTPGPITTLRSEFWLQVKSRKTGNWNPCGPDVSAVEVFKNIEQLKRLDPSGQWRCVLVTTAEQVVMEN